MQLVALGFLINYSYLQQNSYYTNLCHCIHASVLFFTMSSIIAVSKYFYLLCHNLHSNAPHIRYVWFFTTFVIHEMLFCANGFLQYDFLNGFAAGILRIDHLTVSDYPKSLHVRVYFQAFIRVGEICILMYRTVLT